jgi:NAD+ diphosphatase
VIDPHINYSLGSESSADSDSIVILVADKDTAVLVDQGAQADDPEDAPAADEGTVPEESVSFPTLASVVVGPAAEIVTQCKEWHQIATWQGRPVYALSVTSDDLDRIDAAGQLKREDYRSLYLRISDVELGFLARAIQIVDWHATSRYCPACGTPTVVPESESVARCPECGHTQYPRLAPAMIVAVVRDGKLLLAHAPRFRNAFYSILAGFVEPGETVEACVHREVFEEARVKVKNVRYFGSQSWPFPHSLMLGFTAEWESGEIEIDGVELEDAGWYAANELPPVPSELSISGRLIRWFRETHG